MTRKPPPLRLIQGHKGGSSQPRPAQEAADTLTSTAYARIIDLVSEGEIEGFKHGPDNFLQDIYLDQTPVANPDNSLNFTNVQVDSRSGTQDQDYVPGFDSVENEIAIGVELKSDTPFVRAFNNIQLSAVRIHMSVPSLQQSNTSTGDITGYTINYKIEVQTDGAAYQTVLTAAFSGKASGKYERTTRIDLPPAIAGWNVRVTRLTANANSATIADTTNIDSVTEIVDGKFRYPNSAYVAITVDASQFQSVPTRSYHLLGKIMQVPSNYDPVARTYAGVWDGSFKPAYTNNPAWAYYHMATEPRYGLGNRIGAAAIDKFRLYRIAQYCDEMVADGKGGLEPRFTCNLYLQTQADAYKVMQDLASIFRGMSYWGAGQINASADMPDDPVYTYNQTNVVGGLFTYQGAAKQARFTVALVSWNDPANFYQAAVEYVPDDDGIAQFGIQQTSVTAIGCTSQGQAQRVGKWTLLTSRLETETVNFQIGLDGAFASPGQIIRVADPYRAGRRLGGRARLSTPSVVTVDQAPVAEAGDTLTVNTPQGGSETRTIQSIDGLNIHVTEPFTTAPPAQSIWIVESTELTAPTYRVLSVTDDGGGINFTITALRHVAQKFDAIDNGTKIALPPTTVLPPSVQPGPTNVVLVGRTVLLQGIQTNVMTISWDKADQAIAYSVEWKKDSGDWILAGRVSTQNIDVQGIYTGKYTARVRAINAFEISSLPTSSAETDIVGKTGLPPSVTHLTATPRVFGLTLDWGFPAGAEDTERTEIWRSNTNNRDNATKLADLAYPQATYDLDGLSAGASFFFWARLVDKTGNVGPWYPVAGDEGVNGQASSDADEYNAYFAGLISKTALNAALQADIDAVQDVGGQLADMAGQIGAIQGEVDTVSGVIAYFNPPMAGATGDFAGDETVFAGVYSEQSARADADSALGQRMDTVAASLQDFDALIQTETQARIDADGALATQVTTVQATAGSAQALAQNTATATATLDGKVSAFQTFKVGVTVDGQYYGAGMAIGIDNSAGPVQSQILFQADRFAIINVANGVTNSPFVLQGGQLFINQALIGTGWITNAMIGSVIQSTSTNAAGQPTWIIDKAGTITLHGDLFSIVHSSTGMVMATSAGVTVMKVGLL